MVLYLLLVNRELQWDIREKKKSQSWGSNAEKLRLLRTYIDKLQDAFRKKMGDDGFKYRKGNPDIYSLLQQYGREDLAKRFALQLRALYTGIDYATHKPCTMVDKLVEELEHPELLLIIAVR